MKWEYLEVTVEFSLRDNMDLFKSSLAKSIAANGASVFNDSKKPEHLFVYFNQLGKDGWELVSHEDRKFYFKRPLESAV